MELISQREVAGYRPPELVGQILSAEKLALLSDADVEQSHYGYLPWKKCHDIHEFRPAELTVWSGETKSMKSMLSGYILMHLALQRHRVAIASFEMPPQVTFERMAKAFTGKSDLNRDDKFQTAEALKTKLFVYDYLGIAKASDVYNFIDYSANELMAKHIMVDSLMCVSSDTNKQGDLQNEQKEFISHISRLAKSYGVHVHLVCHFRKPEKGNHKATIYDIMGTSAIPNLADNIFIVQKNHDKEDESEPDIFLSLGAQRLGQEHWNWGFKMHRSFQFLHCSNLFPLMQEDLARGCFA